MKNLWGPYISLIIILVGLVISCNRPSQIAVSPVPAMDITTISDTINIVLDSNSYNYQIVPLETNPSALIGDGAKFIFLTSDYILVETGKGLQQFNRQGRFIRQIMSRGKGPNEYLYINPAMIHKDELYFMDISKNRDRIYCCNLTRGDLTSFPMSLSGRVNDFVLISDSAIMIINDEVSEKGRQCRMFIQNLNGNVIDRKELGRFDMRSIAGPAHIQSDGPRSVLFSNPDCDTVFRYSDNQYSILWIAKNLSDFIPGQYYEKFQKLQFQYYSNDTLFLSKISISQSKKTIKYNERQLVAIVPGKLKAAVVRSFRIRDLDFDMDPGEVNFLNKTSAIVEYSAFDFKKKIGSIIKKGNLEMKTREQLISLDQSIGVNDNPVLIFWKL